MGLRQYPGIRWTSWAGSHSKLANQDAKVFSRPGPQPRWFPGPVCETQVPSYRVEVVRKSPRLYGSCGEWTGPPARRYAGVTHSGLRSRPSEWVDRPTVGRAAGLGRSSSGRVYRPRPAHHAQYLMLHRKLTGCRGQYKAAPLHEDMP